MDEKVKEYLLSLDADPARKLNDFEVSTGISEAIKPFNAKPEGESLYELLAFDLFPRNGDRLSEWGTYFGSKMSFNQEDGTKVEYPPLSLVTKEAVEYWAKRAREAKHPISE